MPPLATRPPFHLEATVRVLQRRPSNLVDVWDRDRYRRALRTADGLVLVEVENRGRVDEPDLHFAVDRKISPATRRDIVWTLRTILGLDVDPAPLLKLANAERGLRATAGALRGMRPPRFAGLFEAFARVLPYQQLSLEAGIAIVTKLVARFGERVDVSFAFPTARSIAEARLDALRRCGLSTRKAESLRNLARIVESRELTEEMIDAMRTNDALRTLIDLPGIGPWSASLVLLRGFGRLDVFPPGDVGVERGLPKVLHVRPGAPVARVIEHFGDRRGYLYFFSLAGSLLETGLIHPAP